MLTNTVRKAKKFLSLYGSVKSFKILLVVLQITIKSNLAVLLSGFILIRFLHSKMLVTLWTEEAFSIFSKSFLHPVCCF